VAQRQDRAADGFEMRIPAQVGELRGVRRALVRWLDGQGAPPEVGGEVALAVHEAAANAVEHAYPRSAGELIVRARHDGGRLVVVVEDEGDWRPPSRTDQRGRGPSLMHGLMDDVEIVPSGPGSGGTRVTLRRQVAAG
jgi:serine/threonine-protein kinase RsbW